MTDFEKLIYNVYLAETRKGQNKPYKRRENFDKVDESTKLYLLRLSNFFKKHRSIDLKNFFQAPYKIYKDKSHHGLDFYLSMKAIKLYREYINKLNRQNADSDDSKEAFRRSAKFVLKFCKNNKIKFEDYIIYRKENEMNSFFDHLKHGKVSIYFLFMFSKFDSQMKTLDVEMRKFILGDIVDDISKLRAKFYNCNQETKNFFNDVFNICKKA